MPRLADVLATRRANKRRRRLFKKLQRSPDDRQLKAELWLRCKEFREHGSTLWGWNPPLDVTADIGATIKMEDEIEAELGLSEIVDRIEHLIDPLEAKSLRKRAAASPPRRPFPGQCTVMSEPGDRCRRKAVQDLGDKPICAHHLQEYENGSSLSFF